MIPRPTVLVVDDDPALRSAVACRLAGAGFRVEQACSADAAMAALQSHEKSDINLLCTDIDMPGSMDGLALAATVARRWPAIQILVTSGRNPGEGDMSQGSAFIAKSLGIAHLVGEIVRRRSERVGQHCRMLAQ